MFFSVECWTNCQVMVMTPPSDSSVPGSPSLQPLSPGIQGIPRAEFYARPNSHPFQNRILLFTGADQQIKVGRSVARSKPSPNNGIFDCKGNTFLGTLLRKHFFGNSFWVTFLVTLGWNSPTSSVITVLSSGRFSHFKIAKGCMLEFLQEGINIFQRGHRLHLNASTWIPALTGNVRRSSNIRNDAYSL